MNSLSLRALVDLDNVLCKTDAVIRRLIKRQTGRSLREQEVVEFDYSRVASLTPVEYEGVLREFHRTDSLSAKPIRGARLALKLLSATFRVTIVTGRPAEFRPETLRWLQKNRMKFDELVFSTRKWELAKGSAFLVEDSGETALTVSHCCLVYLFDYPWNSFAKSPNIRRIKKWNEILADVRLRLDRVPADASPLVAFHAVPVLKSVAATAFR